MILYIQWKIGGLDTDKIDKEISSICSGIHGRNGHIEKAIRVARSNLARILKLGGKDILKEGFDADVLLLDKSDFFVNTVISNVRIMLKKKSDNLQLVNGGRCDEKMD